MKKNLYAELIRKHQEEFNQFPCFFAFNNEQFKEGMGKLGLKADDTDKIYRGVGGMYYKRANSQLLKDLLNRHDKEFNQAITEDITGEGFTRQMFQCELANHEYGYTYELEDTLDAVGMTTEQILKQENLKNGLELALKEYH